jgi:phage tail-like protein
MTWNVVHAYPIKWSVSEFNAEKSQLAIESIELAYNYFNIQ